MSSIELKARARRIAQELLTQGDLAAGDEIFALGCIHHGASAADATSWIETLRRAFPDLCAIVEEELAEGETVVQRLAMTGTHRRAFLGVPPSGRRASWQVALLLHAGPGGTFVEQWTICDRLDLVRQLGGVPAGLIEDDEADH